MKRSTRSTLIVNVLAVIEAWHRGRHDERAGGNNRAGTLNDVVDAIKRAMRIVLKSASIDEVRDVSEHADSERITLDYVQAARFEERALQLDPETVN